MIVTGERVITAEGGFNPTWQRHVATYRLCADLLPEDERVLDLGCGVGHSFELLAPRETVGVDIEPSVLEGQNRETVVADMRKLPFDDTSFKAAISVQALEHIPDPERMLSQVRRVLELNGVGVFVTPNRLTFGSPEEIIDPYHYHEFDPEQLRTLMAAWFKEVRILGIFGSARHLKFVAAEHRRLRLMLHLDPLRLRRFIPRRIRQLLYDTSLTLARRRPNPAAEAIGQEDFYLAEEPLDEALDLVAVVTR